MTIGIDSRNTLILVGTLLLFPTASLLQLTTTQSVPPMAFITIAGSFVAFLLLNIMVAPTIRDLTTPLAIGVANTIPTIVVLMPTFVYGTWSACRGPTWLLDDWQVWLAFLPALAGVSLLMTTEAKLLKEGKGTLSPMDDLQTKVLVVDGLYAYVRNPMIVGAFSVIVAALIFLDSLHLLLYAVYFVIIKTLWFILAEEPSMRRRFGQPYNIYCQNVGRWIPRCTPYRPK